jgi:hypothetical protein
MHFDATRKTFVADSEVQMPIDISLVNFIESGLRRIRKLPEKLAMNQRISAARLIRFI